MVRPGSPERHYCRDMAVTGSRGCPCPRRRRMDENRFEPRPGRMRSAGSRRGRKYLDTVLAAAAWAGFPRPGAGCSFSGSRIGRGGGAARMLGGPHTAFALVGRSSRRDWSLGGKGRGAAHAHLRYIQRDGAQHVRPCDPHRPAAQARVARKPLKDHESYMVLDDSTSSGLAPALIGQRASQLFVVHTNLAKHWGFAIYRRDSPCADC
jgi:hypothetical protein